MTDILGIYVKLPEAGRVKTRLAAGIGDELACELYTAFVTDLIARFRHTGDRRFLCFAPDTDAAVSWFEERAGADFELWPQPEGSLEPRLEQFFRFAFSQGGSRVVVTGSDSPTLPKTSVEESFQALSKQDCVIGPATDGGYYLLGLRGILPVLHAINWSTPQVLLQTADHLTEACAKLHLLPPHYDVDTIDDLQMLIGHVCALKQAGHPVMETLDATGSVLDRINHDFPSQKLV